MQADELFKQLERNLDEYDLLRHRFYEAWSAGELTEEDLREYAAEYRHHVAEIVGRRSSSATTGRCPLRPRDCYSRA